MDGDVPWVTVSPERTVRPAPDAAYLAHRLGLPEPAHAVWVDMPVPYLLLELPGPEDVAAARFTERQILAAGVDELYLYAHDDPSTTKVRFFAPGAGVFEDPATGSAAVALATALTAAGRDSGRLTIRQGDEIGHPSTIRLSWDPGGIRIGGTVRKDETRWLDR
jgi:trans-2,3-dihydro-3-hydroxyanthranilate isomerase